MWRNREVDGFIRWLRGHNEGRAYEQMAGFYGLDLYNLGASMRAVVDFLKEQDPELARLASRRYGCLDPWAYNPAAYRRHSLVEGYARCEVA
jgi:erythromycin esterase-like protein